MATPNNMPSQATGPKAPTRKRGPRRIRNTAMADALRAAGKVK